VGRYVGPRGGWDGRSGDDGVIYLDISMKAKSANLRGMKGWKPYRERHGKRKYKQGSLR
jgi:hypothetical protein